MQSDRSVGSRRGIAETVLHNLSPDGLRRFEALQEEYPIVRHLRFIAYVGPEVSEDEMLDAFEQMARGAQARTRPFARRPRT